MHLAGSARVSCRVVALFGEQRGPPWWCCQLPKQSLAGSGSFAVRILAGMLLPLTASLFCCKWLAHCLLWCRMPPHMALAYQLSGMGISGQQRPSSSAMPGMMQMMPHGYAPAATPAAPMAVIGTDSKTIKIRGLPFRCGWWVEGRDLCWWQLSELQTATWARWAAPPTCFAGAGTCARQSDQPVQTGTEMMYPSTA